MRRFLIFGLLGPAAAYLSLDLATRMAARWWWPQPSIYVVELAPFLLCAFIDRALKDARAWERLVLAGITAFLASGLACALVYRGLGAWVFGFYAAIPAAACSLLATAADVEDATPIEENDS
jgi:hypothetical protein